MESFDIGRTLSRAWQLVIGTLPSVGLLLLGATAVSKGLSYAAAVSLRASFQTTSAGRDPAALFRALTPSYLAFVVASFVLFAFAFGGAQHGMLQFGQGQSARFADCMRVGLSKMALTFGLIVAWYLAIILGMVMLIVPGLFLLLIWSASLPALINENLGIVGSFGRSRKLTKGSRGKILVLLLVCVIVLYFGMFAILGLITGTTFTGVGLAMINNPALYVLQIPLSWAQALCVNALLASIYLETLAIKGGGPAGHLDQVFA